ncbi:hypothetical protein HYH03_010126 [Edaphochlamys debaryana]|uniref:Ysc84 actin-binding domain-containing protein n=1 Tax=Edaphochlamys debaryana TaxID=47281 RepID=A0A835XXQ0_9CHLO|nr:hypothetical protein HYH03_010126 [Edaphochlamys debaryana]|eukprot:KAG2491557.1 hypothetical protein HYH03_010126 [Edaphochlamys debaryana]
MLTASRECLSEAHKVLVTMRESVDKRHMAFPPDSLKGLTGLVLVHSKKGAVGLGYETGQGVAVNVGYNEDGSIHFSGPVPLKMTKLSVGASIGFNIIYTLMAVQTRAQLQQLITSPGAIVGKDINITAFIPYQHASQTAVNVNAAGGGMPPDMNNMIKVVSVSDSYMLTDFSLYGGSMTVDRDLMEDMYGRSVLPMDVLDGSIPAPVTLVDEMAELAGAFKDLLHTRPT